MGAGIVRIIRNLLLIALTGLSLAACGSVIDADQARLCRAVAPALHDAEVEIVETSLSPVPGVPHALKYSYRSRLGTAVAPHWLICSFAADTGLARFDLVAVDTDRGSLSDIKLFFLKRWWLKDLAPEPARRPFFALDATSAYWLQQSLNGLVMAGVYGLIATGFSLVYGLVGRINMAFGEIAVAGGAYMLAIVGIGAQFGRVTPLLLTSALLGGIISAALLSWFVGRYVVLPLVSRSTSAQPVLIATTAVAIVLAEALRLTSPDRLNWLPAVLNRPIYIAGQHGFVATATPAQLLGAGLSLSGVSMLLGLLAFSSFGRAWRAHAQDPLMAAMLGVRIPALRSATFLISGAAAGLAGSIVVLAYGTISPGDGLAITLKALISAIIGGIGSVPGAFLGAALVAGVEIVWSSAFDIVYRDVVIYALLAGFLVLRPGGLLNRAAASPREF